MSSSEEDTIDSAASGSDEDEEVEIDSAVEDEEMEAESAPSSADEDEFLLELHAAGKLKPGLNVPKKQFVNNVEKLKAATNKLRVDLPWVESMDIVNDLAEMAPELVVEMKEQEELVKSGKSTSLSLNEFKRETLFHRQAQLAAIEGIARLKSQGIPTLRPDDYFAEMMKSDEHMQKVRRALLEKQAALKRSQKVREIREHKKIAKQQQVESTLRKQKEKRDLNEEIKKYRKGMRTDLEFLDNSKRKGAQKDEKTNKKFRNKNKKFNPKSFHKAGKKSNRPGKERRKSMKNKKR